MRMVTSFTLNHLHLNGIDLTGGYDTPCLDDGGRVVVAPFEEGFRVCAVGVTEINDSLVWVSNKFDTEASAEIFGREVCAKGNFDAAMSPLKSSNNYGQGNPNPAPGAYYVTVRKDDGKVSYALGPFAGHQEALDRVKDVSAFVRDRYSEAAWWAFGTTSVSLPSVDTARLPKGVLNESLGVSVPVRDEIVEKPRTKPAASMGL